jgi:hypothetical protein
MGRVGSNPTPGATEQNPMFFERTRIVVVDQHSNFIMSVFFHTAFFGDVLTMPYYWTQEDLARASDALARIGCPHRF